MSIFSLAPPVDAPLLPSPDLSVMLVGVESYHDSTGLPDVQSARENVMSWYIQALRMGVTFERLDIFCEPAVTIADAARAVVRWDLPRNLRFHALESFVRWAEQQYSGDPDSRAALESDPEAVRRLDLVRAMVSEVRMGRTQAPPTVSPWTERLLRYICARTVEAGRDDGGRGYLDRLLADLPALEQAVGLVFPDGDRRLFRLAQTVLDVVSGCADTGWSAKGDWSPVWITALGAMVDLDAVLGRSEQDALSWRRVALSTLALDPKFYQRPPTRARIVEGLRRAGAAGGRGLFVYCGHGGLTCEEELVLSCSDLAAGGEHGVLVQGRRYDGGGLLRAADLVADGGPDFARWTFALDTCHAGGFGKSLRGTAGAAAWSDATEGSLQARVFTASLASQTAKEARLGNAYHQGAFTWAVTTALSRWLPTADGDGYAMGVTNEAVCARANALLEALGFSQQVSLAADAAAGQRAFLGYQPDTETSEEPDAQSGGIEIWPGNDEIWTVDIEDASGDPKLRVVALGPQAAQITAEHGADSQVLKPGRAYWMFRDSNITLTHGARIRAQKVDPSDLSGVNAIYAWGVDPSLPGLHGNFFVEKNGTCVAHGTPGDPIIPSSYSPRLQSKWGGMLYFKIETSNGEQFLRFAFSGFSPPYTVGRGFLPSDIEDKYFHGYAGHWATTELRYAMKRG